MNVKEKFFIGEAGVGLSLRFLINSLFEIHQDFRGIAEVNKKNNPVRLFFWETIFVLAH